MRIFHLIAICVLVPFVSTGCDSSDEPAQSESAPPINDAPEPSNPPILFSEDFEDETLQAQAPVLNFEDFSNMTVDAGSVDLLDGSFLGLTCASESGGCVDLDGSNQTSTDDPASVLSSEEIELDPGSYLLRFDMSGSQRGTMSDTVEITFGSFMDQAVLTLSSSEPFTTHQYTFDVAETDTARITFTLVGPSDLLGPILDNIVLRLQ